MYKLMTKVLKILSTNLILTPKLILNKIINLNRCLSIDTKLNALPLYF